MRLYLLALLPLAACAAPLTGDAKQDCLAARSQTVNLQNAVTGATSALAAAVAIDTDPKNIKLLQVALDTLTGQLAFAQSQVVTLCAPPPPILIEG